MGLLWELAESFGRANKCLKLGGFGNGTMVKVAVVVVREFDLDESPEFACFVKTVPLIMGKGVATTVKHLYDFNTETVQVQSAN